jgi:hypothetical protein
MNKARFPKLLKRIYSAVEELEAMFPGRHFTPDGHLVGSLGEALASYYYGIKLSSASAERHDGIRGRKKVQIKATQGIRIAISSEPEHLLVLRLERNGEFVEEYNGPGSLVWSLVSHKPRPKNGQFQVSLVALRKLMQEVKDSERIPRVEA